MITETLTIVCPNCGEEIVIRMDWYIGKVKCACGEATKAIIILKSESE